VFEFSVSTEYV